MISILQNIQPDEEMEKKINEVKKTEEYQKIWKRVVRKSKKASSNNLEETIIKIEKENGGMIYQALCSDMKVSNKMTFPRFEANYEDNIITIRFYTKK